MPINFLISSICLILFFGALSMWAYDLISKKSQLKKYTQIYLGMPEDQMLEIMGGGYNVSSLKNNRRKYEWRINASSSGHKGYRYYTGVKKVDIYTKDGRVEEIRPFNV